MSISITLRDTEIMKLVMNYDRVGIEFIQKAYFPNYSPCRKRLARLVDFDYLTINHLFPTVWLGSGKYLFDLGQAGRRHVAEVLDIPLSSIRRLKPVRSGEHGKHHMAICDFRWPLEQSGLLEDEWITERELGARHARPEPDGRFTLRISPQSAVSGEMGSDVTKLGEMVTYRLEMDMSHHTRTYMREKLALYLKDTDRSIVLWVVPDERRKAQITRWCLEVASQLQADPTMFWIALQGQNPLENVWDVAGGPKGFSLLGIGGGTWDTS